MSNTSERGFGGVLTNRHFMYLWGAQALSMTVQNGIHLTQLVLVEELTRSTAQMGAVILSFSLPAVLLSAGAGIFVDRLSKKNILVVSNALRVLTILAYVLFLRTTSGPVLLSAIYTLTFINSAIGQFFSPAEAAMIPLLVSKDRLLAANSLFNLTFTASQVVGLVIIAPLTVKLFGIEGSFVALGLMYLIATLLTMLLPKDNARVRKINGRSVIHAAWEELVEGWRFVASHAIVLLAMLHLTLIATLLLVMAMLVPGFTARVLGLDTEDAIYIFAPAGIGMFAASFLIGRFGHHARREALVNGGLFALAITFALLAWVGNAPDMLNRPILKAHPESALGVTGAVMIIALLMGIEFALISIPAQTTLQEQSPPEVRGRVFAVQFTLANLVAIPPMLTIGNLADRIGIPRVTLLIAGIVFLLALISIWSARRVSLDMAVAEEVSLDEEAAQNPVHFL